MLQNLGKDQYSPQSLEQVGTRIAKALEKVRVNEKNEKPGLRAHDSCNGQFSLEPLV